MSEDKPGPNSGQVSPEYKSKCMDWALQCQASSSLKRSAADIVKDAKLFYDYVYGNK